MPTVTVKKSAFLELPRGALTQLKRADPALARLIQQVGPFCLRRQTGRSHYELLARSIVFQQLSGKAAATIFSRCCALTPGPAFPRASELLQLDDQTLRAAGLSRQKVAALRDLAQRLDNGQLPLRRIATLDDNKAIQALCEVRGIGPWTAKMFLMFRLGRLDILAEDDLGLRRGLGLILGLEGLAPTKVLAKRGELWRPYRSVASWYLWRLVDGENQGGW